MAYPHDFALCVPLSSGQVLLGGGAEKPLGIGQTHTTEVYDPATHSFDHYGCLDTKRMHANGVETDSGRVVIAGNWYADDQIELYDISKNTFRHLRPPCRQRSHPYLLRTAKDDVLILSGTGTRDDTITPPLAETLKGGPVDIPLLRHYRLPHPHILFRSADCFIGDVARNDFAYLLPLTDSLGQVAVAIVRGTDFQLLPTTTAIPMEGPWGRSAYSNQLLVDRERQRAYLTGGTDSCRFVVVAIDYARSLSSQHSASSTYIPAPLTLYYTDPLPDVGFGQHVLTPDGNLLIAGGCNLRNDNYSPYATTCLLLLGPSATDVLIPSPPVPTAWLWWLLAAVLLIITAIVALLVWRRRHAQRLPSQEEETPADSADAELSQEEETPADSADAELMQRICCLMEEQQLYLNSELKVQDVADALGSNRTYVSNCIKNIRGCSFSQFVNGYRVEYAKQLLSSDADKKLSESWPCSGFSSESSFFRAFKAVTGTTPKDWLSS